MRVVAPVDSGRQTVVGLTEAAELGFWDHKTGLEDYRPNPARTATGARRLAAVEAVLARGADVLCSVPLALCTASHALARTAGCKFLMLEVGTPVSVVREHGAGMAVAAVSELGSTWLAVPSEGPPAAPQLNDAVLPREVSRALVNRLRRVEGQARGVQRLIEEGRDCDAILTQVAAMRSAVNAIGMAVLAENLARCIAGSDGSAAAEASVAGAKRAFQRLN